jgi:hypothetical protein
MPVVCNWGYPPCAEKGQRTEAEWEDHGLDTPLKSRSQGTGRRGHWARKKSLLVQNYREIVPGLKAGTQTQMRSGAAFTEAGGSQGLRAEDCPPALISTSQPPFLHSLPRMLRVCRWSPPRFCSQGGATHPGEAAATLISWTSDSQKLPWAQETVSRTPHTSWSHHPSGMLGDGTSWARIGEPPKDSEGLLSLWPQPQGWHMRHQPSPAPLFP